MDHFHEGEHNRLAVKMQFSTAVNDLLKYDRDHIWHPYTSMSNPMMVYPVKEARGCEMILASEEPKDYRMIDAMSSWWCAIHGYNNQEINDALVSQISKVSHVMFGGLTHEPAVSLVGKLLTLLDHSELQHCFLADSGSVAMEIALKMALQYQWSLTPASDSEFKKTKFLTISRGYHGDTIGAMSVCDPKSSMHSIYAGYVAENIFVTGPPTVPTLPTSNIYRENKEIFNEAVTFDPECLEVFRSKLEHEIEEVCAVVLEPILQGAGGMRLYHPQFLIEVRKLCDQYDVPLIMDEIATGFGRTGAMFAFHHCRAYQDDMNIPKDSQVDVYPDIICVGKALTGGYMTLSAVVTTPKIAMTISNPELQTGGCLMHGPTFMGNPLACAAANKSLDILLRGDWTTQVQRIERQLFDGLYKDVLSDSKISSVISDIRITGAVAVLELKQSVDSLWFHHKFVSKGVYVRPFRNLCYIMPPYIISPEQLDKVTRVIREVLREWADKVLA